MRERRRGLTALTSVGFFLVPGRVGVNFIFVAPILVVGVPAGFASDAIARGAGVFAAAVDVEGPAGVMGVPAPEPEAEAAPEAEAEPLGSAIFST
jgi:hypothetical protein